MPEELEGLAAQECKPCKGEVPALESRQLEALMRKLDGDWRLVGEHHLEREYGFEVFAPSLDFTNEVARIARAQGHHPDILLTYGKVKVTVWTHKAGGLTLNDFILAAKIEKAFQNGA